MGLMSVDPGVHSMAVALWDERGLLVRASNVHPDWRVGPAAFDWERLIGEIPVVYPGAKGLRTDPNDLIALAYAAGRFYERQGLPTTLVKPAEWKAQVPKGITKERIIAELDSAEISRVYRGGEMHNVYDAIGIGLFALGRLKRGMVK
jgi:hypothetical protein